MPNVRRPLHHRLAILCIEMSCFVIAVCLSLLAYWDLAPWPVYRVVAWVVIAILWSNIAMQVLRVQQRSVVLGKKRISVQEQIALVADTTGFLRAIRPGKQQRHGTVS